MKQPSATEENYLKAIYKYSTGNASVATNTLSKYLLTSPASVTDMLKRLNEKKLVNYIPYKGARLTDEGEKIALKIIRKHRLWEVFLVNILDFTWDAVHETAEQLEHVNSPELIKKLDEFLGFPKFDPHGDPIPSSSGKFSPRETILLSECPTGKEVFLVGVTESSSDFLRYLDKIGLGIGLQLEVLERIQFDLSMMLKVGDRQIILSGEFSKRILVSKP